MLDTIYFPQTIIVYLHLIVVLRDRISGTENSSLYTLLNRKIELKICLAESLLCEMNSGLKLFLLTPPVQRSGGAPGSSGSL